MGNASCKNVQPRSAQDVSGGKPADKANKRGDKVGGKSVDIATKGGDEVEDKSTEKATKGGDEVKGKCADKATKGGDKVGGNSSKIATKGGEEVGGQPKAQSITDDKIEGAQSKPRHLYSVTGSRDLNVLINDDRSTGLSGIKDICQLPDGRLLITDERNDKLKLLDKSYTVIDHYDMPSKPASVCLCDEEACVGQRDRVLQFVSIKEKMETFKTINIDHICRGLAYHDEELYVSDGEDTIHVYNKAGTKLRKYNLDIGDNYVHDEYLAVSIDGRQLFMTHSEYLICVDRQSGEIIWRVEGDNHCSYRGVCVDDDNNVMVCDTVLGKIVQYSSDGEKLGFIVDGIREPRAQPICFDQDNKTLLLGKCDVIRVLNLK